MDALADDERILLQAAVDLRPPVTWYTLFHCHLARQGDIGKQGEAYSNLHSLGYLRRVPSGAPGIDALEVTEAGLQALARSKE